MWKFVKLVDCCDRYCKPLEYPWVLKISSPAELMVYEMETSGRYAEAFSNLVNSREFQYAASISGPLRDHITNMTAWAILIKLQGKGGKISVVQEFQDFAKEVMDNRAEMINEYGAIYMQQVGSYFPPQGDT
jgi:hypothetical protein